MGAALACMAIPGVAQITLDNDFADWASIPTAGTVSTNTHVLSGAATSNADWVFWKVTLGEDLALDETIIPHGLQLWVDTDGNPNNPFPKSFIFRRYVLRGRTALAQRH